MKKLIYGAAMAAIALFSACENIAPVEAVDADSEKVILTATLGNDTKTYLEWNGSVFKTRWAEDDEFCLLDLKTGWDNSAEFELVSGAGESTARFEMTDGPMPENYVAVYGEIEYLEGDWFVGFDYNQYRYLYHNNGKEIQGFDAWTMPMIAEGNGEELYFKNLGSVLKLNIVGNGETLRSVIVRSRDAGVYLGGYALMNIKGNRPSYSFVEYEYEGDMIPMYDEIHFDPDVNDEPTVLSSDPVECYIVIPSQTYPSGLAIQLVTDSGYMDVVTVGNLVFSQSELREMPTLTYSSSVDFAEKWRVESDESYEVGLFTEREGDYLVLRDYYIDPYAYLTFYDGDSNEYGMSSSYGGYTDQITNTCAQLELNGYHLTIRHEGYYDIYLDPDACKVFVMNAGVPLSSIPTLENVACNNYYQICEKANETLVKVYGVVKAVNSTGFIMSLSGYSDPVLVYLGSSSAEQQSALLNLKAGTGVELYATKVTYATLPELKNVVWSKVYETSGYYDEGFGGEDITDSFDDYSSSSYAMISYVGVLEISGSYYNVKVDGAQTRIGSIANPLQDLSSYNGKEVYLEGYYAGITTSKAGQEYLNIILTKIGLPDTEGSTEDIVPDDDLVVSTR